LDKQNRTNGIYLTLEKLLWSCYGKWSNRIVTDDTPLKTKEIILNGVYEASPENGISRIVRGIEFLNLHLSINNQQIESNNIDNWNQVVSMKEGTSTTSFTFKDLVSVDYTILANRAIPYSAMAIVEIT
jgi:trehalose/maltose hydrolase-like predicted phosphorylase